MSIRVKRKIIKRLLILLTGAIVLYILMHGSGGLRDKTTSASVKAYTDQIQGRSLLPKIDTKNDFLSIRPPIIQEVPNLRGQDALKKYCNSPNEKTTGNEGTQLEGFNLKMVHVFTRHGDRTSIYRFPGYKPETYNCKFSTWYTGSNEKFQSFPQRMDAMARKQVQNSFRKWPTYPNESSCGSSVLTSRGALQLLHLGQHLYDSYINHFHLFKSHESFSSQMDIKSTGTLRTYQSTIAFLYGFVPEFNIFDFDIGYSQDLQFCSKKFSMQQTCNCPNTRAIHARSYWFQSAIGKNSSYFKKLGKYVSDMFGIDDNDIRWLTRVADALVPSFCHNFPKPCSAYDSSKCVDDELLGKIWDAITVKEFSNWDDPDLNFLKYCSIKMSPLLHEIAQRMSNLTEGKKIKIFNMYSGHDLTVSPLLYVLGLHDGKWPPYASRVVIEMYEEENEEKIDRYHLKILYNGIDKTENVIFCKGRTINGLCNFRLFSDFVSNELLQRFGFSNYTDACLS